MTILPLLLALAALGGARSCDQRPTISASTASKKGYTQIQHLKIAIDVTYGEDITVFCAASTVTNLTILNQDGLQLQAKDHNSSTIRVFLQKPVVGEHTYHCIDNNNCSNSLTITSIYPAVAVVASNIHHALGTYGRSVYFVPRGENYEIFCSANEVKALSLDYLSDEELETKAVNETTVVATNITEGKHYVCGKDLVNKYFKVIVDYKPEAREFSCILHLNRKLECSWRSSSKRNTFVLSILRFNRKIHLCSDMSGALTAGCSRAWNDDLDDLYVFAEKISLQLEACNEVFCQNQTFEIKLKSIIKVDPVYNLQLLNSSSRSAELAWRHSNFLCYRNCEYKVKYRLGTQWREVDVSTLGCHDFSRDVFCMLQISLPCPNTHYEARVYVKPRSATEDCWSDPTSMLFFNTPRRFEEVGPPCSGFREPEPTPSANALNEVRLLVSELNLHVKQKIAEINALLDTLA